MLYFLINVLIFIVYGFYSKFKIKPKETILH